MASGVWGRRGSEAVPGVSPLAQWIGTPPIPLILGYHYPFLREQTPRPALACLPSWMPLLCQPSLGPSWHWVLSWGALCLPTLPPLAPSLSFCALCLPRVPTPGIPPAPAQILTLWSGLGVGSPLTSLLVEGVSCLLQGVLWKSKLPSLSGRGGKGKPEWVPRHWQPLSPASAFPWVAPKEKRPRSAHSVQRGASSSWTCLFPWTNTPGFPRTRPQ